ncbi:MAG: DNA methyltransferase [Aerococcus suis]|nr:DNA methyltransferase [Aerococcus suis]
MIDFVETIDDGQMVFDYPKPVDLIKRTIDLYTDTDDIILDFFSGSGTTAHAVMDLNAEDDSNRKYIMVQLPEKIEEKQSAYKSGYRTIDEIGRERIDRAAKKIKEDTDVAIDYGYKLYYLENSGHDTLNQLEDFTPEPTLFADDFVSVFDNEHAKGKENILATWMNEDGYGLSQETEEYRLSQYTASLIDKTLYIIDQGLESADVMELIKRIENNELQVSRVVAYIPSIQFNVLQELKKNIKVLKNADTKLIERF